MYLEWYELKEDNSTLTTSENDSNSDNHKSSKISTFFYFLIRILGVILFLFSLIIIVAEMTIFLNINLSLFGILINKSPYFYNTMTFTILPFVYLINTTLYSLFHLKLSGVYGVYKNKHTDSESLLILSSVMCRIAFPLGLNFIQILKLNRKTIIESVIGSTNFIPVFGEKFTIFYPTILGLLCLFNYFNVFGSILSCLGLSSFGFENEATNEAISEGNQIFEKSKLLIY
jgi:hypothetical protein